MTDEKPAEKTGQSESPTQGTTDWIAEARKWEERSKSNYSELQTAQSELEKAAGRISELEKETARIPDLEKAKADLAGQVETFQSEKAHAELVSKVAKTAGVPASALRGSTEEELTAHADILKPILKPSAPVVNRQAQSPGDVPVDESRNAVRDLFGNKT